MKTVLLSAPYMIPFVERFKPVFEHYHIRLIVPRVEERLEEADILEYAGEFDGAICGDDRYSENVLQRCQPRLRVISKWGTGIDSIDRQAAGRMGIQVRNTPNAFTEPVADSVMGYLLAFARRLPWMDRALKQGAWEKLPGRALNETTLGVIGVGNIGKAVLHRASGFEMKMLGNDIVPIDPGFTSKYGVEMLSLEELLDRSDFVSLNCDLNPTSRHIISKRTLSMMRTTSVLINTARGPLVDEGALVSVLLEGTIAGAALDVFETEPLPQDSPLRRMDQVMLAAHNSNSSPRAWERVHWNTIRNLVDGLGMDTSALEDFEAEFAAG